MAENTTIMNSKERLLNAVYGRRTDRPPVIIPGGMMAGTLYEFLADDQLPYPLIHTQVAPMVAYAQRLQHRCALDNFGVPFCMTVEAEAFGADIDLGTPRKEPRINGYPAQTIEAVASLAPDHPDRTDVVLAAVNRLAGTDVPVVGNIIGPVSLLTSVLDAMQVYRAFEKKPEAVHRALSHLSDYLIDFGRRLLEAGADIVVIADPSASGEIIGPEYFNTYAAPYLHKLIASLRSEAQPVILHVCGNLRPVIQQLEKIPWDVLSVDSVMALKKLATQLPGRTLMGNLSTRLLAESPPDKVVRAGRRCIETAAILSPACGISTLTPMNNIKAMVEAAGKELS